MPKEKLVSQAEFARLLGVSRPRITQLKKEGKLVLSGGFVNYERSLKKLEAERDVSKVQPVPTTEPDEDKESRNEELNVAAIEFQAARAEKEGYKAKLSQAEYEKTIGSLVHREGVMRASFQIGRNLRNTLMALPSRLAPALTIETDQKRVYAMLEKEISAAVEQIIQALAEAEETNDGTIQQRIS
jgi:phage terminase Nu1 subunit (DNA packaging protein)